MEQKEHHRQGDILFLADNNLPDDVEQKADGIVMRGSYTGHSHVIRPGDKGRMHKAQGEEYSKKLITGYLKAEEPVSIMHDEHHPTNLDSGVWEIRRQRTYEPDGWSLVED